jgi:hypothetical protein
MPALTKSGPLDPSTCAAVEAAFEAHRPAMDAVLERARLAGLEYRRLLDSIHDPLLRASVERICRYP